MTYSLRVNGELTQVSFRLSDQCLIGLLELVKSVNIPTRPEVTLDEIHQFRVSRLRFVRSWLLAERLSNIFFHFL